MPPPPLPHTHTLLETPVKLYTVLQKLHVSFETASHLEFPVAFQKGNKTVLDHDISWKLCPLKQGLLILYDGEISHN